MGVSRERKRKHKMDLIGEKQGYRNNLSCDTIQLRQEVIKWIKERIKNCVYACRQGMICKEHKFWMERFNITEEDLK